MIIMETQAEKFADALNAVLEFNDIQICNYSRRFIVKKGSKMVARGNSLYVNGKGAAFLYGSFKAYKH